MRILILLKIQPTQESSKIKIKTLGVQQGSRFQRSELLRESYNITI